MQLLIGLLLIAAGVAFAVFQYRKNSARMQETQFMQTSSVKDAISIVDDMSVSDSGYRHYVELKGTLVCDSPITAPFSNRPASYYANRCLSVSEQTDVYQDKDGSRRTRVSKQEREISTEHQHTSSFLKDNSCDVPVLVNFESFHGDIDLVECCDRFEPSGSPWSNRFHSRYSNVAHGGSRFLGYRLIEKIFPPNGPVYVLGELAHTGDCYVIEKAQLSKKPSLLSYKSEEQIVQDHKKAQMTSLFAGGIMTLVGIAMIIMHFT